jgi:chromosome segregation ATPase
MSACKFHPFQKLTDDTNYFADSITAMTEEDKMQMYQKFAKTTLGQSSNQQQSKMNEIRSVYYDVADATKNVDKTKIKAANATNVIETLKSQKTIADTEYSRIKIDSESKKINLNQQLVELENKFKQAQGKLSASIASATEKYQSSLKNIKIDPSIPPTLIETQKNDLLNIYNATKKNATDEFENFKSGYENNVQLINNELKNTDIEFNAVKNKVDTLNSKIAEQEAIISGLQKQLQAQQQTLNNATNKRNAMSTEANEQAAAASGNGGQTGGSQDTLLEIQLERLKKLYNENTRSLSISNKNLSEAKSQYKSIQERYSLISGKIKNLELQKNSNVVQGLDISQINNTINASRKNLDNTVKALKSQEAVITKLTNDVTGFENHNIQLTAEMENLRLQIEKQKQQSRIDTYIPREPWKPKDQYGGTEEYGLALHDVMPPMFENKQRYVICPHSISNNSLTAHTLKNINNSPMFNMFSSDSRFATGYSGLRTVGSILSQQK